MILHECNIAILHEYNIQFLTNKNTIIHEQNQEDDHYYNSQR